MAFSFGMSNNYSDLGKGVFRISPLMWTNAANALTFLALDDKVRQIFCWDMLKDNYEEAAHIPLKAAIVVMLLLSRIKDIPLRYQWQEQADIFLQFYDLQKPHQLYDDYCYRAEEFDLRGAYRMCRTCCFNCIPAFSDILFLIDRSSNLPGCCFINRFEFAKKASE